MMCECRVRDSYHPGQPVRSILICHFMTSTPHPKVLSTTTSCHFQRGPRSSSPLIKRMHILSAGFGYDGGHRIQVSHPIAAPEFRRH